MSSHADEVFIRNFLALIGALLAFAVFSAFVARVIGDYTQEMMQAGEQETLARIAPVGEVRVSGSSGAQGSGGQQGAGQAQSSGQSSTQSQSTQAQSTQAQSGQSQSGATQTASAGGGGGGAAASGGGSAGKSGEAVFNSTCTACHTAGVAGAPKVGDAEAWKPRAQQGMDTLVQHALNGKGAMPPKGGAMSLSKDEIQAAIEYMLSKTGVEAK